MRVQPFADDHFNEYQARRKEPTSSVGLIAGLVIGIAAVAGIGWYMWSSGAITMDGPGGAPQLVKANPEPYKIKPENPGGMKVENQDKLVYDRVAKGDAPPRVENLLPGPEEPKAPPKPAPSAPEAAQPVAPPLEAAKVEPAAPVPETPKPEAAKPEVAKPEPAKVEPAKPEPPKEVAKAEPAKPAEPNVQEQDDLAALVAKATGGREAATGPLTTKPVPRNQEPPPAAAKPTEPQVAEAPPPVDAPVVEPAPAPPAAAMAGGFQIQLASARSEQGAMGEWNRIIAKNKEALSGLTPTVARVDLGDKGVFFRLRAGPLADRAAADNLCAALSAQNVGCIVVRP
ncbi:MAG: SPOR domain-containing protein [Rhodospirillaceae bacterium]